MAPAIIVGINPSSHFEVGASATCQLMMTRTINLLPMARPSLLTASMLGKRDPPRRREGERASPATGIARPTLISTLVIDKLLKATFRIRISPEANLAMNRTRNLFDAFLAAEHGHVMNLLVCFLFLTDEPSPEGSSEISSSDEVWEEPSRPADAVRGIGLCGTSEACKPLIPISQHIGNPVVADEDYRKHGAPLSSPADDVALRRPFGLFAIAKDADGMRT